MKIRKIFLICFGTTLVMAITFAIYINSQYLLIKPIDKTCAIGIIDSKLTKDYDNIICNKYNTGLETVLTHGDIMIGFAKKYCPNIKIYYFDATNENNKIDSKSIINGLEWMIKNQVKVVNLSLSSKVYNQDIVGWIDSHVNDITIFASYNNLQQTSDYPAMYTNITGSGVKNNIAKKNIDIIYHSNKIRFYNDFSRKYDGNSYLSVKTTIDNA